MRTRTRKSNQWPAWRYGPGDEAAIFENESEVPYGWTAVKGEVFVPSTDPIHLDRGTLEELLRGRGINPLGHWSARHMKDLLE